MAEPREVHSWDALYESFKKSKSFKQTTAKNLFPTFWKFLKRNYKSGVVIKPKPPKDDDIL